MAIDKTLCHMSIRKCNQQKMKVGYYVKDQDFKRNLRHNPLFGIMTVLYFVENEGTLISLINVGLQINVGSGKNIKT